MYNNTNDIVSFLVLFVKKFCIYNIDIAIKLFQFYIDNLPLGGLICTPRLRACSFATATLQRIFLSTSDSVRNDVSCRVTRRPPVPAHVHFPCDRKEMVHSLINLAGYCEFVFDRL